eukprot:sb/3475385/
MLCPISLCYHTLPSTVLDLEYRCGMVEDVEGKWDVVPGGGLMFTTINRTLASWALAIVAAENIVGFVPPGTHEYHKLVPPQHLSGAIRDCGFEIENTVGMRYNPLTRQWSKTSDLSVNYAITARKLS